MEKPQEPKPTAISPFHDPTRWEDENEHAFAVRDAYPLSTGHTLIVPKRAVTSTDQLSQNELLGCFELIESTKRQLTGHGAEGFNVGVNQGQAAGQTIDQLHFHVIPRRRGDVPDPVGGIRNIFPGKGNYMNDGRER